MSTAAKRTSGECGRRLRRFLSVALLAAPFLLAGYPPPPDARASDPGQPKGGVEERSGIMPVSIRLTGADHFIDFRFRVTDSEKAAAVLSRKEKAYLIDQETKQVFTVPVTKLGPLRGTDVKPKENRQYVVLFANANKTIKDGSKVTVVMGDLKIEDLTVGREVITQGRIPQAKQQEWESVQKTLRYEQGVCEEHCGNDADCVQKCEKAYKSRLEKEYQRLIHEG